MVTEVNKNTADIGGRINDIRELKRSDFVYIDCESNEWHKSICMVSRVFDSEIHLFCIKFPWTFFKANNSNINMLRRLTLKE